MTTKLTELLRVQLAELNHKRDSILAKSGPLREARDKFANEAREKEMAMNAQIKEAETGLADLDRDRAMLARALGGRRMSDAINKR